MYVWCSGFASLLLAAIWHNSISATVCVCVWFLLKHCSCKSQRYGQPHMLCYSVHSTPCLVSLWLVTFEYFWKFAFQQCWLQNLKSTDWTHSWDYIKLTSQEKKSIQLQIDLMQVSFSFNPHELGNAFSLGQPKLTPHLSKLPVRKRQITWQNSVMLQTPIGIKWITDDHFPRGLYKTKGVSCGFFGFYWVFFLNRCPVQIFGLCGLNRVTL